MKKAVIIFLFLAFASALSFAQTSQTGRVAYVRSFGAKCDSVTDDRTAIALAITSVTATGGIVDLPEGTCISNGTLTVPGGVTLRGKGKFVTTIKSSANGVILNLVQGSGAFAFVGPKIHDLGVDGSDSGASQIGIQVTDATYVRDVAIEDVAISDCGSHGISFGKVFSSSFKNVYSNSNQGYNFLYNSLNMPSNYFYGLYSGDVSAAAPAGYRIKEGVFTCWSCNGINASAGATSYWAILGAKVGDIDGDASATYTNARFVDSNVESSLTTGMLAYPGSTVTLEGMTTFVGPGGAGTWKALDFDTDSSLLPENSRRGYISDTVLFSNYPLSYFANSEPIHSDGLPPISLLGRGPRIGDNTRSIHTYRNSATARSEELTRDDGYLPVVAVTGTISFTNPGIRYIEATCTANCTITLPWPGWYAGGNESVVIKNLTSSSFTVTILANSAGTVNGSALVLTTLGQSVTLLPNETSLDWRLVGTNGTGAVTGAGDSPRLAYWVSTSGLTSTSGLEYESANTALKSPNRFWGGPTSTGAPTFSFTSDFDTGIYNPSVNTIGFAGNGLTIGNISPTGLTVSNGTTYANVNLSTTSTKSAFQLNGALHPGQGGGVIFPFVGGDIATGPGIWWTANANYAETSGLFLTNGLNFQGATSTHDPFKVRKATSAATPGDVIFEVQPSSNYVALNPAFTLSPSTTALRFLELVSQGTSYVALKSPDALAGNITFTLPAAFPAGTECITTTLAGVMGTTPCGGASGANPTATIGLSAVNGVAATFLRSDGAPALSQAIVPTWTGAHTFTSASPQITVGLTSTASGGIAFKGVASGTATLTVGATAGTPTITLPASTSDLATLALAETFTNKTLTTPAIANFSNANHNHQNSGGGGQLSASSVFSAGILPLIYGGTAQNDTVTNYITNGVFFFEGAKFRTTAASGVGTFCLVSSNGLAPTWSTCTGSSGASWSALTPPSLNLTLDMSAFNTAFNWTAPTSGDLFTLSGPASDAGTGYVFVVKTGTGSAAKPIKFTAGGTADGVEMTASNGSPANTLRAIGSGGIIATTGDSATSFFSTGLLEVARGGTNLASGTSGGVLAYTAAGTLASSSEMTVNFPMLGGGAGAAPKVVAGIYTDGTSQLTLGVGGSSVGSVRFFNATSGSITVQPVTGALGTVTLSLPNTTDTLVAKNTVDTFTGKTLAASSNILGGVTMTLGADATGDIYYRDAGGVLTRRGIGAPAQLLTVSGGLPTWVDPAIVSLTAGVSGILPVVNGGTGAATYTTNGVLYGAGTSPVLATAQGAANSILTANAGAPSFSATPRIDALGIGAAATGTGLTIVGKTTGNAIADLSNTFTGTAATGISSSVSLNLTATANVQRGIYSQLDTFGTGNLTGSIVAIEGSTTVTPATGTPSVTTAVGVRAQVHVTPAATSTTTNVRAFEADAGSQTTASSTVTNWSQIYVKDAVKAAGTRTNSYGVYIEAPTGGATINRSLHSAGAAYFATTVDVIGTLNSAAIIGSSTISAATGFQIGGAATSGNYLRGNGTNFVSAQIASGDLPTNVVRRDQTNTYSTGDQDMTLATTLTVPVLAAAAPVASAQIAYDSTANDLEYGDNGTNRKVANLDEAQTFTNKSISGATNTLSAIPVTALNALNGFTDTDVAADDVVPIYDTSAAANRDLTVERLLGLFVDTANGRLTTQSGVAVSTADRTSQSTIYFTPYNGNKVALYDGTRWKFYTFTERSLALSGLTSGKNYDVFLYDNAGTLTLELSAAWTSDTARADALTTQDGVYVKSGATTRRYLGTIRTTSTTTTADSLKNRFVWNYYNRVERRAYAEDLADHTYGTNTERDYGNTTDTQSEWVIGIEEFTTTIQIFCRLGVASDGVDINAVVNYQLDAVTNTGKIIQTDNSSTTPLLGSSAQVLSDIKYPGIGYHKVVVRERTQAGTANYYEAYTVIVFPG